jgi:hypothetical protein
LSEHVIHFIGARMRMGFLFLLGLKTINITEHAVCFE